MTLKLFHKDILKESAQVHLTRATLTPKRAKAQHSHDFYELFWVQNGKVRHDFGDQTVILTEGSIVFIRPGQTHALQGRGDHALVVSLCIHPSTLKTLAKRHSNLQGHLFWADGPPIHAHRDMRQLATLNHAAVQLERSRCDTLAAEAFLLPLCADMTSDIFPAQMPDWLTNACKAAKDPDIFRGGPANFVKLTGKAHPHVSRTMRKHLGQTPSDYINDLRMTYAARALITDADPVSTIATDCGIPNMSHFHKLFRATHGETPLQYRQKFQRNIVQPIELPID